MVDAALIARAERHERLLRRLNVVVLGVAVVVYVVVLTVAIYNLVWPFAVFVTCVLLAELLVFQIVRTLCDHLAIVRRSHQSAD